MFDTNVVSMLIGDQSKKHSKQWTAARVAIMKVEKPIISAVTFFELASGWFGGKSAADRLRTPSTGRRLARRGRRRADHRAVSTGARGVGGVRNRGAVHGEYP